MNPLQFKTTLLGIFFYLALFYSAVAQSNCKVNIKELAGKYDGECKKGLAHGTGTAQGIDKYQGAFKKGLPHGKGIYTWSSGMIYDGEFKNGEKNGEGKMITIGLNEKDSVLTGYWEKDRYVGKYQDPFKIHYKSPLVTGTKVSSSDDTESVIYISINVKGKTESNPNFDLQEQLGSYSSIRPLGRVTKVYVVRYPFRFILTYLGENVDLEIFNEGAWNVSIDINK